MAGRPPKPTALKAIEGNRGKRAPNRNEPDPDYLDNLDPPDWLPEEAKVVWRELAFKLRKAKVLTILDVPMLEKTCVSIATYRKATCELAASSHLLEKNKDAAKGEPTNGEAKEAGGSSASLNPWAIVQSMAFKQATLCLREFGMSPAARSRVVIDPQLGLFGGSDEKSTSYFTG